MGTVVYVDPMKNTICTLHHLHVMVFGLWSFLHYVSEGTVIIYDLCMLITLIPIHKWKHCKTAILYISFYIQIAGITALCMSLNLNKYTPHISKKTLKKNIWFTHKVHWSMFVVQLLAVLHFNNLYTSFCYCYIATEVLFQFIKKTLTAWILPKLSALVLRDSSRSIKY